MAKKLTKKNMVMPASKIKRILAYIIDIIIINYVLLLPITNKIKQIVGNNMSFMDSYNFFISNPQKATSVLILSVIMVILSILYFSILEFKLRKTIGKMILNIKVVSKQKEYKFSQALIRNISKPISLLFIFDIIYLYLNRQSNQRYFEKISNTAVIQEGITL